MAETLATPLLGSDDLENPPPASIPGKVTLRSPDGTKEDVRIVPSILWPDWTPPGGWYGPFGFLRILAYVFFGIAVFAALLLIAALFSPSFSTIFARLLLSLAAFASAAASYSHEGLAKNVSLLAKRNTEYSCLTDEFGAQLVDLADVADKLEELSASGQANLDRLTEVLAGIVRVSDLNKLGTIVQSFTEAELRNFMHEGVRADGRLTSVAELKDFLDGCISVLTFNIPSLNIQEFRRYALRGHIGLLIVSLIVAAANSENQEERHCFMAMMFFILDPHGEDRKQRASHYLVKHLRNHPVFSIKAAIDAELDRLMATVDPKDRKGRVSEAEVRPLAAAAITTIADADDDIVVSRSLEIMDVSDDDD